MRGERPQLGEVGVVEAGGLVRVATDRRVHLREVLGGGQRGPARGAVGADGEHPRHPGRVGGGDELGVRRLAQLEMGVAVDHALFLGNSGSSAPTDAPDPRPANAAPA